MIMSVMNKGLVLLGAVCIDVSNQRRSPTTTPAVPEPSTWAMMPASDG